MVDCAVDLLCQDRKPPVYLCYYCTELELCQACLDRRTERFAGGQGGEWRVLCLEEHRHIKTPVEGWEGIRDGILRLEGREVPFREWLDEVKEKR